MDELQDIFLNEIMQNKPLALPPVSKADTPSNQSIKKNGQEIGESQSKSMVEEKVEDQDTKPKSTNLLMNILHK
jgi:hypothetical protein